MTDISRHMQCPYNIAITDCEKDSCQGCAHFSVRGAWKVLLDNPKSDPEIPPAQVAKAKPAPSALDTQIGGEHYKDLPIQPVEFITRNKLGFLEGCVIKRVCRWRSKNGVEDLRKAIHELQLLIELDGKS